MSRLCVAAIAAIAIALAAASPVAAVTGGTPTERGEYPHLAALLDDGSQYCDGSLVAPGWILTAAHCTEDVDVKNLTVEIGGDYLEGSVSWAITDAQNEVRSVSQMIVHPSFDSDTLAYDVALLRLSSPSTKTPLPLADAGSSLDRAQWEGGDPARVIGYGLPSGPEAGTPLETDVHMVSDADCETSYAVTGPVDSNTMVCAGEVYGVKDSCFGDSGGPLMVPVTGSDLTTQLMQVGVVSWGTGCGVPTQYGVYSRVADNPLNDWVRSGIGGGGASPTTKSRKGPKPKHSQQQQGNKH
jgi:secreted trypsin-like serine protease